MDLMTKMCMQPSRELFQEQLAMGRKHMPKGMPMHEVWTQTMNDANAMRTFNDALYFIFVFLVGCPGYTAYVTTHSNAKAIEAFLPILRTAFESLMLGRAPGDKRAETASAKEFQGSIDFTMAMRSQFLRL